MTTESTNVSSKPAARRVQPPRYYGTQEGPGWVRFAGTMLVVAGAANVIGGIAAVSGSSFFVGGAHFITGDVDSLGAILLAAGAVQLLAGIGIWSRAFWAVWLGILSAGVNAIAQLLFLPAQPFWSISIFAVDVLVMFALITYAEPD